MANFILAHLNALGSYTRALPWLSLALANEFLVIDDVLPAVDPKKRPQSWFSTYWYYNVNQLGCEDISAQIDLIDEIRRRELAQPLENAKKSQELPARAFQSISNPAESPVPRYTLENTCTCQKQACILMKILFRIS